MLINLPLQLSLTSLTGFYFLPDPLDGFFLMVRFKSYLQSALCLACLILSPLSDMFLPCASPSFKTVSLFYAFTTSTHPLPENALRLSTFFLIPALLILFSLSNQTPLNGRSHSGALLEKRNQQNHCFPLVQCACWALLSCYCAMCCPGIFVFLHKN